ncbi:MAG: CARDB domain-containing protein [Chloroflexota bacterium]
MKSIQFFTRKQQQTTHYPIVGVFLLITLALLAVPGVSLLGLTQTPAASAAAVASQPDSPLQNLPDLTIDIITVDPAEPSAGSEADVTVIVRNQGDVPSGGFRLHLYIESPDDPPSATTQHTAQTFNGLGLQAGDVFEFTRTGHVFNSNSPVIYAWVDRDEEVAESDETNNLYRLHINPPTEPPVEGNPDDYEVDDTCDASSLLEVNGAAQMHNLYKAPGEDGDTDWVQINVVSGVRYTAIADAVEGTGDDADLFIELHPTCQTPPSFGSGAEISFTAYETGVYYLMVGHNLPDYGPNTDYLLSVTAEFSCDNHYEPNNICQQSNSMILNGDFQEYDFCEAGDVDWMHFDAVAGAEYEVNMNNLGADADAVIELFDSCEAVDLGTTALAGSQVRFPARKTGPVYLRLFNDNGLHGENTTYNVQVNQLSDGCTEDEFEEDDSSATAKFWDINVNGATRTHNVCPAYDFDWVEVQANEGQMYLIETVDLGDVADPVVCLYDSDEVLLMCDTDSGAGNAAQVSWQAPASGTYYLSVHDEDFGVAGAGTEYTLKVSSDSCSGTPFEPNDSLEGANDIGLNAAQYHTFCKNSDEDWMGFEAQSGTYYITADPNSYEVDPVIQFYNSDGELLASNNDHGRGFGCRIEYTIEPGEEGRYYIKAYSHDPAKFGENAGYEVLIGYTEVDQPTPTPEPTATPYPTPTPTPTYEPPAPSEVRSLILVNRNSFAEGNDAGEVDTMMGKLNELATHEAVDGHVIQLQNNADVQDAYQGWANNPTSVAHANQVADAIRRVIMNYLEEQAGIEYVVLVGSDMELPFHRIKDPTTRQRFDFTESFYKALDEEHPIGAALAADYILTDDFYIDRIPGSFYVPNEDLAIGRLVESPADIIGTIDYFLGESVTTVESVLVTGYDFVQDAAHNMCTQWTNQSSLLDVNCELIGSDWDGNDLRDIQQNMTYDLQILNGHARHDWEGTPNLQDVSSFEIAEGLSDIAGGLLYTLGCHGGLNVPYEDAREHDLVEAFAGRGVSYVGNTGYGWGHRYSTAFSEELMERYTEELRKGSETTLARALVAAKNSYVLNQGIMNGYDEKVIQQVIFYGLPMQGIEILNDSFGALDDNVEEFPSVGFSLGPNLVRAASTRAGQQSDVSSAGFNIQRQGDEPLALSEPTSAGNEGAFYTLDEHVETVAGQPIMPLHFSGDINDSSSTSFARSAVIRGGTYNTQANYDAVIASPYNEYTEESYEELDADVTAGWYPSMMTVLRTHAGSANLISQFGQYHAQTQVLRLFEDLQGEVYYSSSPDFLEPTLQLVSGVYDAESGTTQIKVGVDDASGIVDVFVGWFEESNSSSGTINTQRLTQDGNSIRWTGEINSQATQGFFIQAVDGAGNVLAATNDGHYYQSTVAASTTVTTDPSPDQDTPLDTPTQPGQTTDLTVYLPIITR